MTTEKELAQRPEAYRRFVRPLPQWYSDAKLGIFAHWGPYSVPAWAEPIGQLGTIDFATWYRHNPYAEWYANTSRIPASGAQLHQAEVYGGAPYDEFIDAWRAERFDPDELLSFFASVGARYFVPTTKHHDGVTLWDAPGTDGRNTVARGPHRDLVAAFAAATRRAGLKFGVYYSGGLDWHFADLPPIAGGDVIDIRPRDAAYARYAHAHVADLIERHRPDVLWGDIEWPDAGKPPGSFSLVDLFDRFYAAQPDGVVNDRFGDTHWDFRTSEYQHGLDAEAEGAWEHTRGIGYSFGYNRLEGPEHTMSGPDAVRHFVDVVSRGGNLLLNVGLTAAGQIPALQRATLDYLRGWNDRNGHAVFGSRPMPSAPPVREELPVRWTTTAAGPHAFVDGRGEVILADLPVEAEPTSAQYAGGTRAHLERVSSGWRVGLPRDADAPVLLSFPRAS
jgi:alpha-L-fucosidase